MRKNLQVLLGVLIGVGGLAVAIALGVGRLTWSPAINVTAAQPAGSLEAAPMQQIELPLAEMPSDPTQALMSQLYQAISPSVVNIQVSQSFAADPNLGLPNMPQQGQGTGWIWDEQGHIVTNNHVVENAVEITVFFDTGQWAEAELVAADPQADLAVIQIVDVPEGLDLRPLPRAEAVPSAGYYALAFGSPFGLAGSMTKGIISAVGRSFPVGEPTGTGARYSLPEVIQTDAAINPGNSGGPLVDLTGRVIGVNFAIRSAERANSGVGFAIPVSIVNRVIPALIEEGVYTYPYLGVAGQTVSPFVAEEEELAPGTLGVFVGSVPAGGPAAEAGVLEGDVIVGIDDAEVRSFEDLISYLVTQTEVGQTVTLRLLRDGEPQTVEVTLAERPVAPDQPIEQITVGEAIDIAEETALEEGLLSQVESASAALEERDGESVWVVTLEGVEETVTVIVDAVAGNVLGTEIE